MLCKTTKTPLGVTDMVASIFNLGSGPIKDVECRQVGSIAHRKGYRSLNIR